MVLVYVLGSLSLLSLVAMSLSTLGSTSYRLARNTLDIAQDEAVAEAAVNRAVLGLLDPRVERRWRVDGVAQAFRFNGIDINVMIQDELGRIDLNHADAAILSGLFQSVGLDHASATKLVDKVLDWRDAKVGRRLHGATAQDYRTAGLPQVPRGGPFQSVDELQLVMGMTEQLFRSVEPALTVYSARPMFDPQVAPREALLALPNMTTAQAGPLMAARARRGAGVIPPGTPLGGRAFTIRLDTQILNKPFARDAVVRLTNSPTQPYWLLNWKAR